MFRTAILAALCCVVFSFGAEARQRHHITTAMHPLCNILFPCQAPSESSPQTRRETRGAYIARQMGIGAPVKQRAVRVQKRREPVSYEVPAIGNGIVRAASGAVAHVAASATSAFQCLVTALEGQGYPIRFMGGWRAHGSVPHSLHPAGLALDVNQLARNVTKPAMPSNEIALANGCGLVSGAQWGWADSGHFQLGGWAGHGRQYASRRHRHRYASR